jgi:hypothetical protein
MGSSHVTTPWTVILIPARSGDDAVQETAAFSFVVVQQALTDLHSVVFMFLCEHLWAPPGTNFAIFQCYQHLFQCIEANIQLHTQFPGRNPPICADELIEVLFISWADSCAGPPGTWTVSHIAVTTAETHHPLPYCAHILCLVSINIQQVSLNVNGCNFFCMEEFNDTPPLRKHFHVRRHFSRLLLFCYLSHGNKTYKLLAGRFNLYCHTTSICL